MMCSAATDLRSREVSRTRLPPNPVTHHVSAVL